MFKNLLDEVILDISNKASKDELGKALLKKYVKILKKPTM